MSRTRFISLSAGLVTMATLAYLVATGNHGRVATAPRDLESRPGLRSVAPGVDLRAEAAAGRTGARARPGSVAEADAPGVLGRSRQAGSPDRALAAIPLVSVRAPDGSPPQVVQRAARAQAEAREQLAELSGRYRLTPVQQLQAIPIAARAAPSFDPSFVVNGVAGGGTASPASRGEGTLATASSPDAASPAISVDDQIHAILDPAQQMDHALDEMDKVLWWQEILGQLEDELDRSLAAAAAAEAAANAGPAPGDVLPVAPGNLLPGLPAPDVW